MLCNKTLTPPVGPSAAYVFLLSYLCMLFYQEVIVLSVITIIFKSTCIVTEVKFVRSDRTKRKSRYGYRSNPKDGF